MVEYFIERIAVVDLRGGPLIRPGRGGGGEETNITFKFSVTLPSPILLLHHPTLCGLLDLLVSHSLSVYT